MTFEFSNQQLDSRIEPPATINASLLIQLVPFIIPVAVMPNGLTPKPGEFMRI